MPEVIRHYPPLPIDVTQPSPIYSLDIIVHCACVLSLSFWIQATSLRYMLKGFVCVCGGGGIQEI